MRFSTWFAALFLLLPLSANADFHLNDLGNGFIFPTGEGSPKGPFVELEYLETQRKAQEKREALWKERCAQGGGIPTEGDSPDEDLVTLPPRDPNVVTLEFRRYQICRCGNGAQIFPLHERNEPRVNIELASQMSEFRPDGTLGPIKQKTCNPSEPDTNAWTKWTWPFTTPRRE